MKLVFQYRQGRNSHLAHQHHHRCKWLNKMVPTSMQGSVVSVPYTGDTTAHHHHHCQSILRCYGNEARNCAPHNFFHNISTKCTRDSTFATKKGKTQKPPVVLTHCSLPLCKITRLVHKEWAAECLLPCWSGVQMIQFTLTSVPRNNPSYLILAGVPSLERETLAFYITARHRVCCMMKGGGCRAREAQPFPGERSE